MGPTVLLIGLMRRIASRKRTCIYYVERSIEKNYRHVLPFVVLLPRFELGSDF